MDPGTFFLMIIVLLVVVGGAIFFGLSGALGAKRSKERDLPERPAHTAVDLEQSRRGERTGVPTD